MIFLHNYLDYIVFETAEHSLQSLYDSANKIANSLIDNGVSVTSYGADTKKIVYLLG